MSIKAKIFGLTASKAHNKHIRQENAAVQTDWWHISRKILPPTIKEGYDHLVLTDGTYIKCIVVGVPHFDTPGYSRTIDPGLLGGLLNTAQERCFIGYSFALSPFGQADSTRALENAEFRNVQDQMNDKELNTIGHIRNKTSFIATDIHADQQDIHDQKVKQFFTSAIITIRADSLDELDVAYSHVTTILSNNLVGYTPAEGRMLEAYKSAQPWGTPADFTVVDCLSPQVATLLPVKRLDNRTDVRGIWFGNQKMANPEDTGKEIMVDLSALSAEHGVVFGPTGAGKTAFLMCFGMRVFDQANYRVIYLTVKADSGTQFRNVPNYYQELGNVIDLGVGKGKSAINPLQILYDETMLEGTQEEALRIYHKHKMIVAAFFDAFLKTGLTDNQAHYLDKTLNDLYANCDLITVTKNYITCNQERWKDGDNFPIIHELRELWGEEMASGGLKRLHESAESLYNRTGSLSKTGAYAYINTKSTADFSKDFIAIDLSGLDKGIQDAMSVLMIETIGARFNTDAKRKTVLIIDEGVSFAHSAERQNFISNAYMMGRSGQVAVVMSFTHPGNIDTKFATMLKTNSMWSYIFGKGTGADSVEYIRDFFKLAPEDELSLINSEIGEGLMMIGNQTIPIHLKITDHEMAILKGIDSEHNQTPIGSALMILGPVADLVAEHGICFDEWIENPNPTMMKDLGYEPHLVQRVAANGKVKTWVLSEIVDKSTPNNPKIYNQTLDHYASVIQIAGHLIQNGFEDVTVNHFDDEDVRARLGDQEFSFEYERPGSHTEKQLGAKRIKLESTNSRCFFVCQSSYRKFVAKAVGEQNTYTRGTALKTAIDAVLSERITTKKEDKEDE